MINIDVYYFICRAVIIIERRTSKKYGSMFICGENKKCLLKISSIYVIK